jgi:radical SAM superfamily enzyme YgiQ (UPF0313 family)
MRLTLVKPNIGRKGQSLYLDEGRMQPLQLGLLAGLTPADVDIALVDDRCEPVPYDTPTDLVAITVETFTARRAYEISAEYRSRGVPVVLGGFHPTLLPEEAALHADAVVVGDAEPVWHDVLRDAQAGRLQARYAGPPGVPQNGVVPRRDLFRGRGYIRIALVQAGRGCTHGCSFCAVSAVSGRTHTHRAVAEVIREIESQDRRLVFFVDDNLIADRPFAAALFRALQPLRLRWVGQAPIDMVADRELMDLMVASGCLGNVIGFESLDPTTLQAMGKTPNLAATDGYEGAIKVLKSYGLQTWAAFTLGHDGDTPASLYGLLEFALRHKFTFAAFNVLMPYPGTPLYRDLQQQGRLLYDGAWWLHPDYRFNHAAFKPRQMSADELTDIAFDIRCRWNRFSAQVWRFLDPQTNLRTPYKMALYWLYNPLFRREMMKKQGMRFGYS